MPEPSTTISARAQHGFAKSAAYDEHRPAYSPTLVQHLLEQLRVAGKPHARLIDLAAGTGKLTEALAARDEEFEILAVEPHEGMREVLIAKRLRGVSVLSGTADAMPVEDESVDAVVVAQAFHWFANMESLREIHRVLRPHGALGLAYNAEDYNAPREDEPTTAWEARVKDLSWRVAEEVGDEEPRFRHLQWKQVFDEQVKKTPLSLIFASDDQMFALPLGEHVETFETALAKEGVWERFSTLGHIAALEGEHRKRVHQTFMEVINGDDVPKNEKGEVIVHGKSYALWTTKIPAEGRASLTDVERPGA